MIDSTTAAHTPSRNRRRVAEIIANQTQEGERARLVRRLASVLLQLLRISPEEATLASWLGDHNCHIAHQSSVGCALTGVP